LVIEEVPLGLIRSIFISLVEVPVMDGRFDIVCPYLLEKKRSVLKDTGENKTE